MAELDDLLQQHLSLESEEDANQENGDGRNAENDANADAALVDQDEPIRLTEELNLAQV